MISNDTTDEECYQMVREYVINVLREDPNKELPVGRMGELAEYLSETGIMKRIYSGREQ